MISMKNDKLTYSLGIKSNNFFKNIKNLKKGDILEVSPHTHMIIHYISDYLKEQSGYFLTIDYGYLKPTLKSTISTIYRREKSQFLEHIGESDVSAFVDFSKIQAIFKENDIESKISNQSHFLLKNGIVKNESIQNPKYSFLIDKKYMGSFKVLETCI